MKTDILYIPKHKDILSGTRKNKDGNLLMVEDVISALNFIMDDDELREIRLEEFIDYLNE